MSVAGDFKVIGINDEGTASRFGGDDLDKIAKILNGEDLSLDIIIDNDWIFNSSKLILHDTSGNDHKITIATSDETADWIITLPTLGGNQTPVFEDLEQTLSNKTLDDVTLTGTVTLPSNANTPVIFSKPALGSAERMISFQIEDDDTGSEFSIQNGTGAAGVFVPQVNWRNLANTNFSGVYVIETDPDNDTGTTPLFVMDFRKTGAALTTRPMIRFATFGTAEYEWSLTQFDMKDNELVNASIDGDDNTITNIPDDALSANVPLLDAANEFTDVQTVTSAGYAIKVRRDTHTAGLDIGIEFDEKNDADEWFRYAAFLGGIITDDDGAEDGQIKFQTALDGALGTVLTANHVGNLIIGRNQRLCLSQGSLTAQRIFTFPDESGQVALQGSLGALDDLTDVDVTTVTPVDNYVLTYSSGTWIAAEAPGASGGEANTLTNVGGEKELVKSKVGVNYDIRTLKAGTNVTLTQNTNDVTISATDTNTVTDALTELTTDVSISSPSNNQVLAYNSTSSKWENNSFNAEKTGTATGDGNGSSVEFTVNHALGSVPSSHFIQCYSHSIPFTWEIDSSDFTVTFDSAPDSGTDNVKFVWRVVA